MSHQNIELKDNFPYGILPNGDEEDKAIWSFKSFLVISRLSPLETYGGPKKPKVEWGNTIWFTKHIHRYSTVVWLAIRGRLNTRDRLLKFGLLIDPSCVLVGHTVEYHNHLFFDCCFWLRSFVVFNKLFLPFD